MNDDTKKRDDSVEETAERPVDESIMVQEPEEIMTPNETIETFDGGQEPSIVTIPILPLRGTVVFPHTVVPLAAAQARSLRLIDNVMSGDRGVGLLLQNDSEMEGAGPTDVRAIGTVGSILQMM